LILGEVVDMNSHVVSVRATDGEILPLEFDSRTVMSANLPAGTPVRVTFRLLDNGVHLAQRITPLEKGSADWERYENELALGSRDDTPVQSEPAVSDAGRGTDAVVASLDGEPPHEPATQSSGDGTTSTPTPQTDPASPPAQDQSGATDQQMPPTASPVPLTFAAGSVLLAGAGLLWWMRRRRES
jgi:cell division septation protein DedD